MDEQNLEELKEATRRLRELYPERDNVPAGCFCRARAFFGISLICANGCYAEWLEKSIAAHPGNQTTSIIDK